MEEFKELPIDFCNFSDDTHRTEPSGVVDMRSAMQRFA
jgi:threonyl-tRNA synthetase